MSERALSASRGSDRPVRRDERGAGRLAVRRRVRRRRFLITLGVLSLLLCAGVLYGLQESMVRISHIEISGADQSFADIAKEAMQGSYFGIIPRDSIFFFPASRIRADIIHQHPDIAAVSIFRNGFSDLSINVSSRVPIANWCGTPLASTSPMGVLTSEVSPTTSGDCYLFDASSFIYATGTDAGGVSVSGSETSPEKPLTPFILYSRLQGDVSAPVGATLRDANQIPAVFDFARQIESFGPAVISIVIRSDEVDFFLAPSTAGASSGPRITYLLGDEQNAFTALVSAKDQLNLSDPALEYVDLRFHGKIYFKRIKPLTQLK